MIKKSPLILLSILVLGIVSGCQGDVPRPKTTPKILPIENLNAQKESITVLNQVAMDKPSFFVQYQIRGDNLLVECILSDITFRESDQAKKRVGKMIVSVDGKKKQEVNAAAFIIKGIPTGKHRIKLDVVDLKNNPYGMSKEFFVNVQKD